jgi:general stress protein 26
MASDDLDRVWALADKIGFCMLATLEGGVIRARPMAAHAERGENAFYFLTDAESHKDQDIEANPNVNLAFADPSGQKYVSISGRATVSDDRAKIKELWTIAAKAWWDYWDSPGTVVSTIKMVAAAATRTRPALGRSATVSM